jgi:hypothetical protein
MCIYSDSVSFASVYHLVYWSFCEWEEDEPMSDLDTRAGTQTQRRLGMLHFAASQAGRNETFSEAE